MGERFAGTLRHLLSARGLERLERRILLCGNHPLLAELPAHAQAAAAASLPAAPASLNADMSAGMSAAEPASLTVPLLSSRPGARQKLYLDFDGQSQIRWGSWAGMGGSLTGETAAFDTDGDPLNFSEVEREQIKQIWSIVTEKFSIFDLDVTTFDPGSLDDGRACKVVIGGNGAWLGRPAGGVAYRGGFNGGALDNDNVAWVWDGQGAGGNVRVTGEAVAHEAGHMFGLQHQSIVYGDWIGTEYRNQFIMGMGDVGIAGGRWGRGEASHRDWFDNSIDYGGLQDDVATMIGGGGLHLRGDDHLATTAGATAMTAVPIGFQAQGVINGHGDDDMFRFTPPAGRPLKIRLTVNGLAPMLNPAMSLYDGSGTLIATADSGTVFREVYGEELDVASASGSYYLKVLSGQAPAHFDNVGMYTITIDTAGTADNSYATARFLQEFGSPGWDQRLWGRSSFNDVVNSADAEDWYAFYLPYGSAFTATLGGLTADADLYLYKGWGALDLTEDLIASSASTGLLGETIAREYEVYTVPYFVRVVHPDPAGASANYTLTLLVDGARPGASRYEKRIYEGESNVGTTIRYGDFVGGGDVDQLTFSSEYGTPRTEVDLRLEAVNASVLFEWGYANTFTGLADADVIGSTVVPGGTSQTLSNQPVANATGRRLHVRVTQTSGPSSNYVVSTAFDHAPMPTLDVNDLLPAGPLGDYGPSLHGVMLRDAVDQDDPLDAYDLGVAAPGHLSIDIQQLDPLSPSHLYELIRDANDNRKVDVGEIVATSVGGESIDYNVANDNKNRFFLRVRRNGQTPSASPFVLRLADGVINAPFGRDMGKPRVVQLAPTGTLSGYVGIVQDSIAELSRHADYFAFTVGKLQQFAAELKDPIDGIGLQVIRDLNNNAKLDPDERLVGAGLGGAMPKVVATLEPASYFLVVIASQPDHDVRDVMHDYNLSYSFDAVADATPVKLLGGNFEFARRDALGLRLELSEDAQMTLGAGDILIERLGSAGDGNTFARAAANQVIAPLGQVYDPAIATLGLVLPAGLPDGNYRVTIRGGSIADPFGNRLEGDQTFDFFVLAGDANHDRHVDAADLAIFNANLGKFDATFGEGDFNYDGAVDALDEKILKLNWLLWLPEQGQIVDLPGTSAADAYELHRESNGRIGVWTGVGNAATLAYRFPVSAAGGVSFAGSDGADALVLVGAAGEADGVSFDSAAVSFAGLVVQHSHVESLAFDGQGGWDSASLFAGATVTLQGTQQFQTLNIAVGARASAAAGGSATLVARAGGFSIAGILDLTDNALVIDYAANAASPIGTPTGSTYDGVTGLIQSGRNGGAWDGGSGIVTSMPDALTELTTLAIAEAGDILGIGGSATAMWNGVTADGSTLLVRYTYGGDSTLDGKLDADDYGTIDFNILIPGSSGYSNGDFNWDGVINADDYGTIDFNILAQNASSSAAPSSSVQPSVHPEDEHDWAERASLASELNL